MTVSQPALKGTRVLARAATVLALALGISGLAGWIFDSTLLKTGFTGGLSMKANAAIVVCLIATSLLCSLPDRPSRERTRLARLAAFLAALLGALTLSEHVFGYQLGIDELLFSEPDGEAATTSPGRMGPPASLSAVLLGIGLLLFGARTADGRAKAQWFALATCPIAMLGLLGYATGASELYGVARYTGIAWHTGLSVLLLAMGLLLARAEFEPISIVVMDNPGGEVARTMLPAAILLPTTLGWLRTIGQAHGLYDTAFGRAALLLGLIGLSTAIVWRLARRLSMMAGERTAAEQASNRARAEAERLASENVETLQVLESLLAHAPIGLLFFERSGRCVRVNRWLLQTLRLSESDTHRDVHELLPAISGSIEGAIRTAFARGVSTMNLEAVSAPRTRAERNWLVGVFPVGNARGTITLAGAVLLEITERKRLEAEKAALLDSERAARTEAERAATLKDQFLATLSHELRTPLNAILGWTAIAKQVVGRPGDLQRPLDVIERNARSQARLIEDLLDVSRIVAGNVRLSREPVSLASVVQSALLDLAPAAEAKQLELSLNLDPKIGTVLGDAARLQQVTWNLLSNAIKFTASGGRIELSLRSHGDQVELSVSDTGVGIPEAFLPFVFERFRQADATTTRQHGGLGLGLSIVKQLVELHGGSVRVTSQGHDQGAAFVVSLPVGSVTEHTASEPARPLSEVVLTGVRVLVVDDEPDTREFVGRVLTNGQADVSLVASADEALAALERHPTQVMVSDIGMPGKDGYDLIRAVRSRYDAKALPAIAVTAFARGEDRLRALSAGFQLHLAKPIDPRELTRAVANLAGISTPEET